MSPSPRWPLGAMTLGALAAGPLAAGSAAAPAAAQEAPLNQQAREAVEEAVAEMMSEHVIPGLSLAIVDGGRVVYRGGFGTTRPDGTAPAAASGGDAAASEAAVTASTLYRLASVTKPFTSVAVLQLAEAGRLDLDDPVHRHCPSYPEKPANPTLRQLLAHQSGIRHTTDREDTSITGGESLAESVRRIADEEPEFEPGTDSGYTSWGYALLGCVVEKVSGQRYFDYIEERILEPAGMTATFQDRPDFAEPGFSPGYRLRRGRVVPSEVVDTRFKVSASGLISSVEDLARFAIALDEGRLLGSEATAQLFQPQATRDGELTSYTLGWLVASRREYGVAYYFSGSMEGTTALLYLIPERDYAIAILANRERFVGEIAPLIASLNRAVLGD